MEETVSFKSECGHFEFTVKKEFTLKVDVAKETAHDLFAKHQIFQYLHNPNGPAIVHLKFKNDDPDKELFWLNGKPVDDEETKRRMKHNKSFNENMDKILEDGK